MMEGWKNTTLGESCIMYQPKTITRKEMDVSGEFSVYGANGIIGRHHEYNHEESELVIGCRGSIGMVHITKPKSWINGNAMVIRSTNEEISQHFLRYLFMGGIDLSSAISGTAQPQITRKSWTPVEFSYPLDLNEQHRIAEILDEVFANIDDSLTESQSRAHSAKELHESCTDLAINGKLVPQDPKEESGVQLLEQIIQQRENLWNLAEDEKMAVAPNRAKRGRYKESKPTVRENLPEIPSNWTWASLEELSYFVVDYRGKTPPTSETGISIISAANVREGFVDLSPPRFVSEETYNLWSVRGEPKSGDVLITTEAPVGRTAIYPENAKYLLTRRILGARLNERCNPEYIRLCLSAGITAKRIAWHSHGATVPRILKPDLFSVPIPFPPFEEQNRIMQQMRVVSLSVNSVEEKYMRKIKSLDELKQSILQEAFSGKLTGGIAA